MLLDDLYQPKIEIWRRLTASTKGVKTQDTNMGFSVISALHRTAAIPSPTCNKKQVLTFLCVRFYIKETRKKKTEYIRKLWRKTERKSLSISYLSCIQNFQVAAHNCSFIEKEVAPANERLAGFRPKPLRMSSNPFRQFLVRMTHPSFQKLCPVL